MKIYDKKGIDNFFKVIDHAIFYQSTPCVFDKFRPYEGQMCHINIMCIFTKKFRTFDPHTQFRKKS